MTIRRISTLDELLAVAGPHPVLRWDVGSGFVPPGYAVGAPGAATIAYLRSSQGTGALGLAVLGEPGPASALLADPEVRGWIAGPSLRHASAPAEIFPVLAERLALSEGTDWDWMWTTTRPPRSALETQLIDLGEDSKESLVAFLAEHSPRTHGAPFARPGQRWVARLGAAGALLAIGCREPNLAGIPHLAGIAVAPEHRAAGLGAAITSRLTRDALAEAGVCTLGVYHDNAVAIRLYERLGYVSAITWRTAAFPRGS